MTMKNRRTPTIEQSIATFAKVTSLGGYRYAKLMAAKMPLADQFAVVDAIIAARRRIQAIEAAAAISLAG